MIINRWILLLVCFAWGWGDVLAQSPRYPAWFVHPPPATVTAVGYALASYYPENGIRVAQQNALQNLALFTSARITGEEGMLGLPMGQFYGGNTFTEVIDSTKLEPLARSIVYLDTATVGEMVLVLAAEKALDFPEKWIPMDSVPPWINHLPRVADTLYAVGIGRRYFREMSGWLEAEREARIQLAIQMGARVNALTKSFNGSYREVIQYSVDQQLRNVQVAARARVGNIHYVLVKMPLSPHPR